MNTKELCEKILALQADIDDPKSESYIPPLQLRIAQLAPTLARKLLEAEARMKKLEAVRAVSESLLKDIEWCRVYHKDVSDYVECGPLKTALAELDEPSAEVGDGANI